MAGNWVPLVNQPSFNANAMFLLTDGTVMVQELATANWWRLTPDSSGSYVNGRWSTRTGGPNGPTYYASAVLMDGRLLVAGGEDNFGNNSVDLDAAQIYDPVTDSWTVIGTPGWGWIGDAPGCLLPDGRFLMGSINDTRTAIYDPVASTWTAGPDKHDASSEETWTLMPDNTVVVAEVDAHPAAEKYVISSNTWVSNGSVPAASDLVSQTSASIEIGPAILTYDGLLFATGASGHTAIYKPAATDSAPGSWTGGPDFPADPGGQPWRAFDAPAVLLPNGRVLCIVGPAEMSGWSGNPCHAVEFDGTTITRVPDPPNAASCDTWWCRLLLLPTGEVLCSTRSNNVQVYQLDAASNNPVAAWRPANISVPSVMNLGYSYTLSGTQLNGLSQACSYGDDAQMATNYPIIQLTNPATGQVYYARSHDFSTMGVATGTTVQSCAIDIPSDLPTGYWNLVVIANGIASEPPVSVNLRIYPCQEILDNPPNAGDFNTPAEFNKAYSYWRGQLKACEKEYGSP